MTRTRELAEEISFRLLATRNHTDMEWLIDKLNKFKNEKPIPPCRGYDFDNDVENDCGDAFDY